MKEKWAGLIGYEGIYEISNYGRFKALKKTWICGRNTARIKGESILKQGTNPRGYSIVAFCKNGVAKSFAAHLLVWDHFGDKPRDGRKLQVDHIDEDKSNNRIDNLQLLTNRENLIKSIKHKYKKNYIGVNVFNDGRKNKFQARINVKGKSVRLGSFNTVEEAARVYQDGLNQLLCYGTIPEFMIKRISKTQI